MLAVPVDDPLFLPAPFSKRLDRLAQEVGLTSRLVRV
jgi:hypothetical protein